MLSEEELKSIDELIMLKHFLETEEKYEGQEREVKAIETVLNLVTKLQKENKDKDKQIDLMGEVIFRRFTAQLVIEYGIENKEQFIKEFEKLAKEK